MQRIEDKRYPSHTPFSRNVARFPGEAPLIGVPQRVEDSAFYVARRKLPVELTLPERSKISVDPTAIKIANSALEQAYPREFGKVIPPITAKDILVVSDNQFHDYHRELGRVVGHSFTSQFTSEEEENSSAERNGSDAVTLYFLPNRPILYTESLLTTQQKLQESMGPGITQLQIALVLIHENIHRSAKINRQENPSDALIDLGLAIFTNHPSLEGVDEHTRQQYLQQARTIKEYFKTHNGVVDIWGGLIVLMAEDEDGEKRQLMGSGYDINERLTEMLAKKAKLNLLDMAQKRSGKDPVTQMLLEQMRIYDHASKRHRIITENEANEYLKNLGVADTQLVDAYATGSIPFKHTRKTPHVLYFA